MRGGLLVVVALAAMGCNDPVYLAESAALETTPAPPGSMIQGGFAPATGLYVLPVRRPTSAERSALRADQQKRGLMMPEPWAQARDFDIEIQYSVKNLETKDLIVFVLLDGGNEFGDYIPANYIDPNVNIEDQTPPPHLLGGEPLTVAAGATITGVFREDELQESAIDLEAITRYPEDGNVLATPFRVIEHRSDISRIGLGAVPANDVTPAHVRYAFTVTAEGHVKLDYTVRVRDHNGKLATPGAKDLYVNTAATLAPPAAPPMPTTM
jgi:hypothetical protein